MSSIPPKQGNVKPFFRFFVMFIVTCAFLSVNGFTQCLPAFAQVMHTYPQSFPQLFISVMGCPMFFHIINRVFHMLWGYFLRNYYNCVMFHVKHGFFHCFRMILEAVRPSYPHILWLIYPQIQNAVLHSVENCMQLNQLRDLHRWLPCVRAGRYPQMGHARSPEDPRHVPAPLRGRHCPSWTER